jgi:signal transduction histidine kinase
LTGIKNAAYFLKKKGSAISENDSKAMLEVIEKGISHSDKIINDLLDYAREMQLQLQTCSLEKMLTEASAMVKVPENVKIINKAPCGIEVRSDQNKIERVFINLIKNAVDAMPNGGTLTINCKNKEDNVEVSFADTGIGVPEEILPKLFLPLFTTKAQGMGFGLSICKRIIEAHGGTITVETEKGKGTIFTIVLPTEPKIENGGEKVWINIPESSLLTTTKA